MAIVRWGSSRDFSHLQDRLNRVFGDAFVQSAAGDGLATSTWVPPVDIYQHGDQELVLKAELPDMTREQIDVTVENGTLTIKGEKTLTADVKEEQFHRLERRYGAFTRSFSLPLTVDPNKVSADYKQGVLTVRLPLREDAKPRSIKVDVAA